jgi:hypothetical protein
MIWGIRAEAINGGFARLYGRISNTQVRTENLINRIDYAGKITLYLFFKICR